MWSDLNSINVKTFCGLVSIEMTVNFQRKGKNNTGRSSIKLKEKVKKVGPLLWFSAKNGTVRNERGSLGK